MTNREQQQEELGSRLKEAREYRGYSQKEIADVLGVSRTAISLIENGDRKIDSVELQELANFYDVSIDRLVGESPEQGENNEEVELLARATEDLSSEDREEVLQFAEYLRSKSSEEDEND